MNDENLYTIKKGDTFWDLENEWDIPHGTLTELNPGVDPRRLQIGSEVKIQMPTLVYLIAEEIPQEQSILRKYTDFPYDRQMCEARIDNVYVHRPKRIMTDHVLRKNHSADYRKKRGETVKKTVANLNTMHSIASLEDLRRTKVLRSNELWHFQKNGTVTHPWKRMNNGASHWKNNLVRSHKSTFQAASKAKGLNSAFMSASGKLLLAGDIALSGEVKPSHVVSVVLIGASSTGVGAIFAGIYFVADFGTGLVTGKSISDRLDGWAAEEVGRLELYEGLY